MANLFTNATKYLYFFVYAYEGLIYVMRFHRSFRIQLAVGALVIAGAWYLRVHIQDWLVLIIAMVFVLVTELVNTAIETTLDYFAKEHHVDVKNAKDVAAGAVLVASLGSALLGILVFLRYL